MGIGMLSCEQNIFTLKATQLHNEAIELLSTLSSVCRSSNQLYFKALAQSFAVYISKDSSVYLCSASTHLPQDLIYKKAEQLSSVH